MSDFLLYHPILQIIIYKYGNTKKQQKKTIEDKISYGLKNYTNSITTISAASPRRGPTFKIRVYPPLRSA